MNPHLSRTTRRRRATALAAAGVTVAALAGTVGATGGAAAAPARPTAPTSSTAGTATVPASPTLTRPTPVVRITSAAATQTLKVLAQQLGRPSLLGKPQRVGISALTTATAQALAKRDYCGAATSLAKVPAATRGLTASLAGSLTAQALQTRVNLLALPGTGACGGVATGAAAQPVDRAQVTVLNSTVQGYDAQITMPVAKVSSVDAVGSTFTRVTIPGASEAAAVGAPSAPTMGQLLLVPTGASVVVTSDSVKSLSVPNVTVAPAVAGANDANPSPAAFATKPIRIVPSAYRNPAVVPATQVTSSPVSLWRGVPVTSVGVASTRYVASSRSLSLVTSATVHVRFVGGTGDNSGSAYTGSAYDSVFSQLVQKTLVNANIFRNPSGFQFHPCDGEEMLVVTTPALLDAANTLAAARRHDGIPTRVVQTGSAAGQIGTGAVAIRNYIRAEFAKNTGTSHDCYVPPSYLTLVGDAPALPTFEVTDLAGNAGNHDDGNIGTDNPYGYLDDGSNYRLPSLLIGRIPAASLAEATTVVNKIVAYEDSPPAPTSPFWTHADVLAYFQFCDSNATLCNTPSGRATLNTSSPTETRTFIGFAQEASRVLANSGKTVTKTYVKDSVDQLHPGFDFLGHSLSGVTFQRDDAVSGNTVVTNDINAGRYLVIHRDHGDADEWVHPLTTLGGITGGQLHNGANTPVLISINCSSGQFDHVATYPGESLVTGLLKLNGGGIVGGLGDSRVSPSTENTQFGEGVMNYLYPDSSVFHNLGSGTVIDTRVSMAAAMVAGKANVLAQAGATPSGDAKDEMDLYNWFGDPSMQLWANGPGSYGPARPLGYYTYNPNLVYPILTVKIPIPDPIGPVANGVVQRTQFTLSSPAQPLLGRGFVDATGSATFSLTAPVSDSDAVSVTVERPGTVPAVYTLGDLIRAAGGTPPTG